MPYLLLKYEHGGEQMSDNKNDKDSIKVNILGANIDRESRDLLKEYQQLNRSMSKLGHIYKYLLSLRKISMKSLLYSFNNDRFDIFKYAEMSYDIKLEAEKTWPDITRGRVVEAKLDFDPTAGPVFTKRVNGLLRDLYNDGRKPFDIEISKQRNEEKEERTRYYIKAKDMIEALALFSFYEGKSHKSYESEVLPNVNNIRPKFSSRRSMSEYAFIKVVEQMNHIIGKYNMGLDSEGKRIDDNGKLYYMYCANLIDDMFCIRGLAAFNAMVDWITSDSMMDLFMKSCMLSYNELMELKDIIQELVIGDSQFVTKMIKYWKTGNGYAFESYIRDLVISVSMGFNIDIGSEGELENVIDKRYFELSEGTRYVVKIIEDGKLLAERMFENDIEDGASLDLRKLYPKKEDLVVAENSVLNELKKNKLFLESYYKKVPIGGLFKYLDFENFREVIRLPVI